MNRLANKIHHWFVNGQINGAIFSYLQKTATNDEDIMLFDVFANELNDVDAKTSDEIHIYAKIYTILPNVLNTMLGYRIDTPTIQHLCKYAFNERQRYNFSLKHHWIKAALDFLKANQRLIKIAYPNNMGVESEPSTQPQYNINKWVEALQYIYGVVDTNTVPFDSVVSQVIAKWNPDEAQSFKNWMRYYQEGNASKYNVKTAQILPTWIKPNNEVDNFVPPAKPDPGIEKKKRLDDARRKLRGRLKSVLELCDQYRDVLPRADGDVLRKAVYDLNERVWNLELKASVVDSIMRVSNHFTKRGFVEGAVELKKIAQEVAQDKVPEVAPQISDEEALERAVSGPTYDLSKEVEGVKPVLPDAPSRVGPEEGVGVNRSESIVTFDTGAIDIPDLSQATLRDALIVLERVNEVISGKSVIRALSACDIILASMGIASHFPELGESMAKLLESFNYSSTRISAVISQLRGSVGNEEAIAQLKKEKQERKQEEDVVETEEDLAKPIKQVQNELPSIPAQQIKPQ